MIANITATYDGETVEENNDVGRPNLSTLLHSGDKIVLHEIHNEDQIEDLKSRYADEWDEKVEIAESSGEDDEEDDAEGNEVGNDAENEEDQNTGEIEVVEAGGMEEPSVGEAGKCLNANCNADADVAVRINTGQVRHYCADHRRSADRRGHMIVEETAELSLEVPQ